MKLVFYNNSLNHHQVNVADEFYRILGDNYAYVTCVSHNNVGLKGGFDYSSRPYCIAAGDDIEEKRKAMKLAKTADVCVFGANSLEYAVERAKNNPNAISFELSERWLKRGWLNILSPRLRKWWFSYQRYFRKANFYKLNASAYAAGDHIRLLSYKGRQYKWGYFTHVDENSDIEAPIIDASTSEITPLMWCSRFLMWKHPELPVMMAKALKDKGYNFLISMYGDEGDEAKHDGVYHRKRLEALIGDFGVGEYVRLMGNKPNGEILDAMKRSDIFLFTSDCHEGWGAVANESLANGCVLVASDAIGSTPYLVEDGFNGFQFKSCDVVSLTEKVEWLLTHKKDMRVMQKNAIESMKVWSPLAAATSLLKLIDDLENGRVCSVLKGPASIAEELYN